MPNVLGRTLKYFFDAVYYARSDALKSHYDNPLASRILLNASYAARSGNQANVEQFAQMAATNAAYSGSSDRIANRVSEANNIMVQMRRNTEWVDDPDHPFLTVLRSPNSFIPGNLLMSETSMAMYTHGNAYWYLVTDQIGIGPVREIWPLVAGKCYPDPLTLRRSAVTGKLTIDFRYNLGSPVLLPGENVVHFRTPNLFDYWQGLSKLTSIQDALKMDSGESRYLSSFFEDGNAVPNAIISVPSQLSDPELDTVRRDIEEQFGARRATAIARAGDLDVKILQHTIEEMKVLDGMEFNDKRIKNAMGVPDGLTNASSGTARLAAEIAFAKDAIQPLLNSMAAFINTTVTPLYDSPHRMQIVAKNIIPQDSAMAVLEYNTYRDEDTINGNRKKLNLKPLKLTGKLAKYQPFLDEVPIELVHDLLGAELAAATSNDASEAQGGQGGDLLEQMIPSLSATSASAKNEQLIAALSGLGMTKRQNKGLATRRKGRRAIGKAARIAGTFVNPEGDAKVG